MKRKQFIAALTICITSLLYGCGEDTDRGQLYDEDPYPEEEVVEEEIIEDEIVEEVTPEPTEEVVEEEEDPVIDLTEVYKSLYAPVFEEIDDVFENGYDYDHIYDYVTNGLIEIIMYNDPQVVKENIGYVFLDLNGDDIPELLIGENVTDGMTGQEYANLYGGYSIVDDQPMCFMDGYSRSSYQWMGDGKFFYYGSNSAFSSMYGVCRLDSNNSDFVWDDFNFSEEINGESAYFHNTSGIVDMDQSEELDISGQDFWNRMDEYETATLSFESYDF